MSLAREDERRRSVGNRRRIGGRDRAAWPEGGLQERDLVRLGLAVLLVGIDQDLVKQAGDRVPVLGVCLGHQAIGDAYGGNVVVAPRPMHGKVSTINHEGRTLFRGINSSFKATRYHSLIVDEATLPSDLIVTARSDDGVIMGLSHRAHPVHGVQFHPESIASENGRVILKTFLDLAEAWHRSRRH